ncbi:MAG: tetratricopeptide repeat protein [Flavobacteriales bacterium]|nr:tetratricopeptide repeat protein [Flavobacteriales bacterium]MCL4282856.1 tetratricopeptide repeat protein [Flavobacteriales bacterium]
MAFASGAKPPERYAVLSADMIRNILLFSLLCTSPALLAQGDAAQGKTEDLFREGEQAYRNGAYPKAIGLFTQVLEQDPDHLNAYLQRGFCHSLQQEYEAAVADFTAVIGRKHDHLWAYTSRGSAYNKLGKQNLAIADFNTVIGLDPKNQEAYNNRGWAKKGLGDQAGACADWEESRKMGNAEAKIILKNNRCK